VKKLAAMVEQYDAWSNIAQANAGITIGQLLRGDIKEAATEVKRMFARQPGRRNTVGALNELVNGLGATEGTMDGEVNEVDGFGNTEGGEDGGNDERGRRPGGGGRRLE